MLFEANLRQAGITPTTGRPYHPQTTGKVERFQQTLKKWLRRQPLAASLEELQGQLDEFTHIYNHERPHQGIARAIPIERWNAGLPAQPASEPLARPDHSTHQVETTVTSQGCALAGRFVIHLGVEWANKTAVVLIGPDHATVLIEGTLVRHLTLDHTRNYQPSGRRRGGPRRPRLTS